MPKYHRPSQAGDSRAFDVAASRVLAQLSFAFDLKSDLKRDFMPVSGQCSCAQGLCALLLCVRLCVCVCVSVCLCVFVFLGGRYCWGFPLLQLAVKGVLAPLVL